MKLFQHRSFSGDEVATEAARHRMVDEQIVRRGVSDPRVLDVMRMIPRHLFLPEAFRSAAYDDAPQPIPCGQTISQPYIVASMTELLKLRPESKVLEIGTGSGYQTAVLAQLASLVWTIELHHELSEEARSRLEAMDYHNIRFRVGDGSLGWPEESPFDAIIVAAAAPRIPAKLIQQLADEGHLIIPIRLESGGDQTLVLARKTGGRIQTELLYPVRFVPLLGSEGSPC